MIFLQKHTDRQKRNKAKHTLSHLFYIPFIHRLHISLPAKQAVQGAHHVPSDPPFLFQLQSNGQTVDASTASAFSKPQPHHDIPCLLPVCPPGILGLGGCNSHSTSHVALEETKWSLSALGRVSRTAVKDEWGVGGQSRRRSRKRSQLRSGAFHWGVCIDDAHACSSWAQGEE
jgi:hypothetical protein